MHLIATTTAAADAQAPAASLAGETRPGALHSILPLLRCPVDGAELIWDRVPSGLSCRHCTHFFSIEADIPRMLLPDQGPDIVKEFHETTPFPNYDQLDTRDSLRRKAGGSVFGRMLDEQISHAASVLEVGCGTGQMTNFLGMSWGRTVIGADRCLNSLKVAKEFRDRFGINNSYFSQIDLFHPPFARASFDVVISNGILHHTGDCSAAFQSIARLVKPGGILIVGLYNWLGRLPTLWRRWLIERSSIAVTLFDRRLRSVDNSDRGEVGVIDQYRHPHETRHSIDELLEWFKVEGFDFTASIPTIGDTEFSEQMPLFEVRSVGKWRDRLASEIEMLLTGGKDGGLFVMIGRKRL